MASLMGTIVYMIVWRKLRCIKHRQMPLEACIVLQSMLEVMHDTFIVLSHVQSCLQNLQKFDK